MKALLLAGIALTWTLPPLSCQVWSLEVDDWYITSSGQAAWGPHIIPATQTSIVIAEGKPYEGCAVGYAWPVAKDIDGRVLPPACQPAPVSADGLSWEGM